MRFLVAVDLHTDAMSLVLQARKWAEPLRATVDLVFVDEDHDLADFLTEPSLREERLVEWDRIRVRYQNQLEMLLVRIPRELRGKAIVKFGPAARALLQMAGEYDTVILGAAQRSGLSRIAGGSVADRVVKAAPVPVLTLRPDAPAAAPAAVEAEEPAATAANILPFRIAGRNP